MKEAQPVAVIDHDVQEALDHVEARDDGHFALQEFTDGRCRLLGPFAGELQEGEDVDRHIALEFRARGLEGELLGLDRRTEDLLERCLQRGYELGLKAVLEHGRAC